MPKAFRIIDARCPFYGNDVLIRTITLQNVLCEMFIKQLTNALTKVLRWNFNSYKDCVPKIKKISGFESSILLLILKFFISNVWCLDACSTRVQLEIEVVPTNKELYAWKMKSLSWRGKSVSFIEIYSFYCIIWR